MASHFNKNCQNLNPARCKNNNNYLDETKHKILLYTDARGKGKFSISCTNKMPWYIENYDQTQYPNYGSILTLLYYCLEKQVQWHKLHRCYKEKKKSSIVTKRVILKPQDNVRNNLMQKFIIKIHHQLLTGHYHRKNTYISSSCQDHYIFKLSITIYTRACKCWTKLALWMVKEIN